jgi:hypothetical protein
LTDDGAELTVKAKERAGWFHNYVGNLSLWSGYEYPDEPRFFDDAIRDLRRAMVRLSAFQPRENLADAYAYKARHTSDRIAREELFHRAERLYAEASRAAQSLPETARKPVELRLDISTATALILLEQPESVRRAVQILSSADEGGDPPAVLRIADRATVYNIASCYALLDRYLGRISFLKDPRSRLDLDHPHARGLQYLAYALIAWPDVRRFVRVDSDLASLPGRDMLLESLPVQFIESTTREGEAGWWSEARRVTAQIEEALHGN